MSYYTFFRQLEKVHKNEMPNGRMRFFPVFTSVPEAKLVTSRIMENRNEVH